MGMLFARVQSLDPRARRNWNIMSQQMDKLFLNDPFILEDGKFAINLGDGVHILASALEVDIDGLPALTTPELDLDFVMIYDGSATDLRKISVADLVNDTVTSVQTANYTAEAGETVLCDPSGGTFTVTLPASPSSGSTVRVKNTTSDPTAIVVFPSSGTIDTAASVSIVAGFTGVSFQSDGTNWWII